MVTSNGVKKLLFMSAGILLLATGCAKTAVNSNTNASVQTQSPSPQPAAASQQTSLKELMMGGGSKKCDVSYTQNGVVSKGTIYVGNGKMRGDFSSEVKGKTETSHMINDGKTAYVWVEGQASMAMKMSADKMQTDTKTDTKASSHQSIDSNAKYQYNCSNWTFDSNLVTPPSTIKFTDFSAMMGGTGSASGSGAGAGTSAGAGASGSTQACGACDSLSGTAKTQCRAALSCK